MRDLILRTAQALPAGAPRRRYIADTVDTLGLRQRQAQRLFGWGRDTIRKARQERRTGITCLDAFRCRGRKPAEAHLPRLLDDIQDLVREHLQADPTLQTPRLYCRLSAAEVRRQLLHRKGYTDDQLPSVKTITEKLNALGFRLRKVAKCRPKKKVAETDAIFANVQEVHAPAECSADTLRLSLDTKATVLIGPFSRGGSSRTGTQAVDHDFKPDGRLTPFGIFQPATSESTLFFTDSKVSSDFMVDCLEQWLAERAEGLREVRKLVLDLDNGPENSGQRSQWLLRLLLLAQRRQWHLVLVYYPPYHSKYNAIERLWGILENYWRGALLETEAAVLGYAAHMTYHGVHPQVHRVTKQYAKGVKLNKAQKKRLEQYLQRKPGLEKWAIEILPPPQDQVIT
jgi:transposase